MKITKKQLKQIIKEELENIISSAGAPPYVVKRVGADEYFVKFVNRGEGDYETVFGPHDRAWTTDDEDRAGYMADLVAQRTGFQTTVEPVASV
jgi:hypothetical protein